MDVCLVEHKGLGTRRILKRIRKHRSEGSLDAQFQLRTEREILSMLKHPGIPVIYDYWEDEERICLIEEYIEGLSLQEYLLRYRHPDPVFTARFLIQVLEILDYLHSLNVKHNDLKAEHILIRGDRVVLIDYGISELSARDIRRDENDDIASLGRIADQMLSLADGYVSFGLRRMVSRAKAPDQSARYQSAAEWSADLSRWLAGRDDKEGLLIRKIAVAGNQRGIGTTHTAVSITSYLRQRGMNAFYINLSGRPGFLSLDRNLNTDFREKDGIIYHRWFRGLVDYGPAIEPQHKQTTKGIYVSDCGTDFSRAADSDALIYVVGSRPWQNRCLIEEFATEDSCVLAMTPGNPGMAIGLARLAGKCVFCIPYDADPMHPDRKVRRAYDQIFERLSGKEKRR